MMYFLRSIASRTVGSLLERSTRRSATVTISAPLAARAARVSSSEAYLPVPTMMREWNVLSATFQLSSGLGMSSSADERDELEAVPGDEDRRCVLRSRHDLAVA